MTKPWKGKSKNVCFVFLFISFVQYSSYYLVVKPIGLLTCFLWRVMWALHMGENTKYIVPRNKLLLGYSLLYRCVFFKKLLWDISYAPQENFTYKKLQQQVLHAYFAISLRSANVWSTFERLLQFGYLSLFYLIMKYKKT